MSQQPRIPLASAQMPLFVGIDVGGTSIKFGLVDDLGRTLEYTSTPTEDSKGPEDAVRRMAGAIDLLCQRAKAPRQAIAAVGLGTPGTMDIAAGMILEPPNLPGWRHFAIRDRLRDVAGLPVTFENDANAAAFGEYWIGSGKNFPSIVMFTLGTGVGCGIIIGDRVIMGENSHGGECGHVIIDYHENARLCGCGQRGHLEAYASATAVIARTEEALAAGRPSVLAERVRAGGKLTGLMLAEAADQGDALALEIILQTADYVAVGAVSLMHTIDPGAVILGGAMNFGGHDTALGRRFLERVRSEARRRTFPVLAQRTVIDYASLGGDAGYIGAAGVARARWLAHRGSA